MHGKQIDIGQALRQHAGSAVDKYFGDAVDATTTFSREGALYRAEISVHPLRGLLVQGGARAPEVYAAFDTALERIAKQLRRAKRRLRNHHQKPSKAFARALMFKNSAHGGLNVIYRRRDGAIVWIDPTNGRRS